MVNAMNKVLRGCIDEFGEAFARRSIYGQGSVLGVRPIPTSRREQGYYDDADSPRPSANVYPSTRRDELGGAHGECNE